MPTNLYAASTDLAARAPGIMPLNPDGTLPAASQAAGDALIEAISRAIDSKTRRKPGAFMPSPSSPSPLVVYGDNKYCLELRTRHRVDHDSDDDHGNDRAVLGRDSRLDLHR